MPFQRTPPSTAPIIPNIQSAAHFQSDPNISTMGYGDTYTETPLYVTQRMKRRREDYAQSGSGFQEQIMTMFKELQSGQQKLADHLESTKTDLMAQNSKIQDSIEFMAEKYDEVLSRVVVVEETRKEDLKRVQVLEAKIEAL